MSNRKGTEGSLQQQPLVSNLSQQRVKLLGVTFSEHSLPASSLPPAKRGGEFWVVHWEARSALERTCASRVQEAVSSLLAWELVPVPHTGERGGAWSQLLFLSSTQRFLRLLYLPHLGILITSLLHLQAAKHVWGRRSSATAHTNPIFTVCAMIMLGAVIRVLLS